MSGSTHKSSWYFRYLMSGDSPWPASGTIFFQIDSGSFQGGIHPEDSKVVVGNYSIVFHLYLHLRKE
jgi:hypothetical protein